MKAGSATITVEVDLWEEKGGMGNEGGKGGCTFRDARALAKADQGYLCGIGIDRFLPRGKGDDVAICCVYKESPTTVHS